MPTHFYNLRVNIRRIIGAAGCLLILVGVVSPPSSPKNAYSGDIKIGGATFTTLRWGGSLNLKPLTAGLVGTVTLSAGSNKIAQFSTASNKEMSVTNSALESADLEITYERPAVASDFDGLKNEQKFRKGLAEGVEYVYRDFTVIPADSGISLSDSFANAATLPDRTFVRYLTFIPYEYVDAPPAVCTYSSAVNAAGFALFGSAFSAWPHDFNGNNRSWDPNAITNSKTSFSVGVNWPLAGRLTSSKFVGPTILYVDIFGTRYEVARGQANDSTMGLIPHALNSAYVVFEMVQDVANPLCLPAVTHGIAFDYNFTIYRSGMYSINGVSIAAPNHELYIIDSGDAGWKTVMRRTLNSFNCFALNEYELNPNCKDSGTYVAER